MATNLEHFLTTRRAVLRGTLGLAALPVLGGKAFAVPAEPLTFMGWPFSPPAVQENVEIFKRLYDENVKYELVAGDYQVVAETKLTGGQKYDMLYVSGFRISRWHAAGWIRDFEDLPDVDHIKQSLYPVNLNDLSTSDGKLAALPYYTGHNCFVYNEEHLKKARINVPDTWDALLEGCRKLKKDGISDAPYNGAWQSNWPELSWSLFACWYAEGAKVFDSAGELVPDAAFRKVLEMYQTLYREGLVTADIMTLPNEGVPSFCSGRHTFQVMHDYNQKVANDPALSKIAGKVKNALMPGATHSTMAWTEGYAMGAEPIDLDRAWNLVRFFGGKAKDGIYHVNKRWALLFGAGSAYKELMGDPEVVESFSKWRDLSVTNKQVELARSRDIGKTIWFPEWDTFMMKRTQEFIRGGLSTDQLIDELVAKIAELKKLYQ
ncbi:ABC transporter substrate-binding protein [Sinorhizobium meliloti]|uniref:ABC transporter substrate-binding protein n=1 Tax=Rhizobium meliloti TaxID=382 RepID=UPI00037DF823|nr:extracellular solute-binding protein [Sinorhizobium meliloti]